MRKTAAVALVAASVLTAPLALAQSKEECFNAAEKAQALRREKKLGATREQLLICAKDVCPSAVQGDCVKWLGEVDNGMPSIVVRAHDQDGKDVLDVKVFVDGTLFLDRLQGTSKTVDPGEHRFKYQFPDGTAQEETVLVAEGEKDRVIRVDAKSKASGGSGGGGGGAGPVPWILMGVGAASLVGFGIVETVAQVRYADYKDTCGVPAPGQTNGTCDASNVSALRGAFVTGIVLLGVGVTWLLVGGKKEAPPQAAAFDVHPVPGGAMATWGGKF